MRAYKPVGRQASVVKYDLLSALGVYALARDKHVQKRVLRFTALLTARYNWQKDELSIGRTEIARLWSVDERTVKRELARFRTMGWLHVKRPAARGRVTVYSIDLDSVLTDTKGDWPRVGPDLVARMEARAPEAEADNVVPFQQGSILAPPQGETLWDQVSAELHARDAGQYATWFQRLTESAREGNRVTLLAPSRFVADYVTTHLAAPLLAAYSAIDPTIRDIRIVTLGS